MNPRQRRGLLFMIVALLIAIGTFLAVSTFVANVNSQVGQRVTVYRAKQVIDAYTPLSPDNLEPVEVPRRWGPCWPVPALPGCRCPVAAQLARALSTNT